MKVLFVSAVLPYPPKSGGQIRMYQLLKRMAKKHEITLVSFIRDDKERAYEKDLGFCKKVIMVMRGRGLRLSYLFRALTGKYPLLLATYDNETMKKTLTDLLTRETFELVHLEPFYDWPAIPKTHVPVVVSEHNVEYEVYEYHARRFWMPALRPFLFLDAVKLRLWEHKVWANVAARTAVSPEDAAAMKTAGEVTVVPNGVDLKAFSYAPRAKKAKGPAVLFVGDFRWFPNKDAAERLVSDIWPVIKKRFPGASFRIVGRHIPGGIAAAVRRAGGTVQSDVPDIAEEYRSADALIAPHAIGGGTKFKMLEAMASGLPVITTKEGMAGLAAVSGTHYLQAAAPRDYVAQLEKIWDNRKIRDTITAAARNLVETHYGWDAIARELDAVWKKTYEKTH